MLATRTLTPAEDESVGNLTDGERRRFLQLFRQGYSAARALAEIQAEYAAERAARAAAYHRVTSRWGYIPRG